MYKVDIHKSHDIDTESLTVLLRKVLSHKTQYFTDYYLSIINDDKY